MVFTPPPGRILILTFFENKQSRVSDTLPSPAT